jgi:hypothetical protein
MTIHLSTGTKLYARGKSGIHIENIFSSLYQRWLNALTQEQYSYTTGRVIDSIPRVPKNAILRGNKFTFDHEGPLPEDGLKGNWTIDLVTMEKL